MNKYIAIDHENSKYYKDVPYITKKEFNEKNNPVILGKTRLKEYKSDSDKEVDLLCFDAEQYEVKEKIFGLKKGYVDVGDNNYILLKKRIPFLLLFFLLLLLLFLFFLFRPENKIEEEPPKVPTPIQEEIKIPDDTPKEESTPSKKEENNKPKPSNQKPIIEEKIITYEIVFDANGGSGYMDSIICQTNNNCKLPKGIFTKEGYTFTGWSEDPKGKVKYENETEVFNLSTDKKILYAMWKVNTYNITFLDYDDSIIIEEKYDFGEKIIEPEEPKRKGYNFVGWDNDLDIVKEAATFKATYKVNTYGISYDLNGGVLVDAPSNYDVETDLLKIPNPEKEGYNFIGWSSEDNDKPIKDYEVPTGTTGDIKLKANYEPKTYNLIFNTNGAKEEVSPKEIEYDSEFGELPIVTKEGYTFINWTDKENNGVNSKTIFNKTNDVTIYANWKTISYEIKYNLVGGNIENNPTSYDVESDTIVLPNPIKEGYTFVGWSTPEDNNTFIKDYEIPTGTTGNIELIANYSPISYYISYNSQGAEGTMENTKVKYNNTAVLSKNVFEKEGYIFKGWSTEPDGDVVYNDKSEVYNLASEDGAIFNLYAKWEIIRLKVKYIDLFGAVLKEETVDYGSNPNYPEDPFIDGYTFTGWDSKTIGLIKSDSTYKAKYSINYYDIVYDLNKGQENDKTTIRYNIETKSITLPNPTRTGYTFLGWTGSNGLNPQKDISIIRGTTGNKNYKANWVANTYNVTLNPNKGTVTPTTISISYESLYGILPTPERIGYSFEGWYSGKEKILDSTVMNKASNHELIADWKVINYDIIYDLKGGSLSSPISSYNIESETFTLPEPTRIGYKFTGWTGSNGTTPSKNVVISKGSYGNKNYVANWEVINYSISYNLDGGSASSLVTQYNIETPSFTLPKPSKTGYTFQGWKGTGLSSATKTVTITKDTGNRSYTATWSKNYYTVNYYLNGGLWATRSVGYNDSLENLNGQSALDGYHTFHGWNGWVDRMPNHNVDLHASITEAYCSLTTGHGPYGNASGLLNVFRSAGWTGTIIEAPSAPGYYMVITDSNLTRAQAEVQKNYIASHTNYTSYNFPYLYWVAINCTNGYGEAWTRSVGQSQFN